MNVYVEYVILDNFVVDLLILYLVARALKLHSSKWRVVVGALLGTVFAVVSPLLNVSVSLAVLCKIALALLMVAVLAEFKNAKQYFTSVLLFFSFTFLLGGACLGVLSILTNDVASYVSLNYEASVPVGLIVFVVWVYVRIIGEFAQYIYKRKEVNSFLFDCEVETKHAKLNMVGFLDSGNHLFDDALGLPVIVVTEKVFFALFPELKTQYLGNQNLYGEHFVPYSTVSGDNSKMLVAVPDSFCMYLSGGEVKHKPLVLVGLAKGKLESCYDCLLHPALLGF